MFSILLSQYDGSIVGPIAWLLGKILNVIFELLSNFGIENAAICIIIFTFIVKSLMIPLTIKQQKFTKLSTVMNPEISKITEKYKGKKDEASLRKQQLETQAVYDKYGGVNPVAGCLPLLISMPIIFALYRVIQSIPAYVPAIKELYETIAIGIQDIGDYKDVMLEMAKEAGVMTSKFKEVEGGLTTNNVIDILAGFSTSQWIELKDTFPSLASIITENSQEIIRINSFLGGLNIADAPGFKFPGILIPILSIATQYLQTKMMMSQNSSSKDKSDPTAATMNTMNTIMPIMSGGMCLMLPIGIGIYWVSSSVFQIIQQFFVNRYLDSIDVNELIRKNIEKNNKKKARRGIDTTKSIEEISKQNTKSINEKTNTSIKSKANISNNQRVSKNAKDYQRKDVSYKSGSIAANAHLLDNRRSDNGKGDKS